ncbi:orexigenic neuropeptide QRFP-like [Xenopus laevis]|uniref:Orexigenic neuropeptide QRFP-like n=1 Tax=Xenopus laevis TaxID=8355 RepID=A0A8J1LI88_XENLA|nr:orexigenic neuropeptide QRFP-like [Xenopus laevis]
MRGSYGISVLVLLSLGYTFALQDSREQTDPWEIIRLLRMLPDGEENIAGWYPSAPKQKKTTDPASLFSVAKELQGFGKERAGFRFRFGRQEEGDELEDFKKEEEEKRGGTALGSLAEELNGYNRKKGGFSFRFGRR